MPSNLIRYAGRLGATSLARWLCCRTVSSLSTKISEHVSRMVSMFLYTALDRQHREGANICVGYNDVDVKRGTP